MQSGEVTGARACWVESLACVSKSLSPIRRAAVDVCTREAILSDERGLLWYASDLASSELRPLAVLVQRGRWPEAYGGETPWEALFMVRGWVLSFQRSFAREVLSFEVPTTSVEEKSEEDFFGGGGSSEVRAVCVHSSGDIRCLSPSPEAFLATGDDAGDLRVTALFSKKPETVLQTKAHQSAILAVATVKERIVISGSKGLAKIWFLSKKNHDDDDDESESSLLSLSPQRELKIGCAPLAFCAMSGCARSLLAIASREGTLSVWSADDEPKLLEVHDDTLEPLVSLTMTNSKLATLDAKGDLRLYDLDIDNDTLLPRPELHKDTKAAIVLKGDGGTAKDLWLCSEEEGNSSFRRLIFEDDQELERQKEPTQEEEEEEEKEPHPPSEEEEEEDDLVSPPALENSPPKETTSPTKVEESPSEESPESPPSDDEEALEQPRLSPPRPTPGPPPPTPNDNDRRIASTAALARPQEDLTLAERQALAQQNLAEALEIEAHHARTEQQQAERNLAEALKPLPSKPLASLDVKDPPPRRQRLLSKQVDIKWLDMRDKLRPQAQDFAIPGADPQARIRLPLAPVPIDSLLPTRTKNNSRDEKPFVDMSSF